jgi:hypothetical protein
VVEPEVLVADVALVRDTASAPTPFARGGWLFRWLCVGTVAFVAGRTVLSAARRRRGAQS